MATSRTVALDCMGGDHGAQVVVAGAAKSSERHPALQFLLFGDQSLINAELAGNRQLAKKCEVVHTDRVVSMTEKPSQALRRGKGSSMWMAVDAVKQGRAHVAVSAGNTGALMAMSKILLRPMAAIERPAIAALWPTVSSECIVLDV
ncbi:MAG: phosphate acyltransferase, partial [Pseudomonadota bacterium]